MTSLLVEPALISNNWKKEEEKEEKNPFLPKMEDLVNHPSHYCTGQMECIEAIEAQLSFEEYRGYMKGNIVKYLWREKSKGGVESLKKAHFYLERLIAFESQRTT